MFILYFTTHTHTCTLTNRIEYVVEKKWVSRSIEKAMRGAYTFQQKACVWWKVCVCACVSFVRVIRKKRENWGPHNVRSFCFLSFFLFVLFSFVAHRKRFKRVILKRQKRIHSPPKQSYKHTNEYVCARPS